MLYTPSSVAIHSTPTAAALAEARAASEQIRGRMVALQEELDWETYRLYGLIQEDMTYHGDDLPGRARRAGFFDNACSRRG